MLTNATTTSVERDSNPTRAADIRLRLQAELVRRRQANARYSLRAFALFLGVESSRLSKILRGERPVSLILLNRFAQQLGLTPREVAEYSASLLSAKHGPSGALTQDRTYVQLSQDAFDSIEDWRHYAILELMKVQGFRPDLKYIAKRLRVSLPEARAYVERLVRVGLLVTSDQGVWTDRSLGFSSHILSETETTTAHKRSQLTILDLAKEALENIPMSNRDQSSMMMATHSSKIEEAKQKIKKFRRELCEFLEDCESKDAVFQLAVSLFPLATAENNEHKEETTL